MAWVDAAAHELRCPRCSGRLERVEIDAVHVEQCARCLGCFVRTEDFSELLQQEERGQRVDLRFAPTAGRELPRQTLLAPVRCPHCPREMDRARFAQRAEIVVDVCAAHGLWLDAGELPAILTFVKDRVEGHATLSAAEREEQAQWDRIDRLRAEEARVVDYHTSRAEDARRPGVGTVVVATAVAGPWAGLFFALRGMHKRR
jgi:Zn-finger nucleic acid-binding protein